MICETELKKIKPKTLTGILPASYIQNGVPIPKVARIKLFSPDEWEAFTEEWASSLELSYIKVRRFGGAGDLGIDVAGFYTENGFEDGWDNYQCKRYNQPLQPNNIWVEMGKIIYYSYGGHYIAPLKHYFVCSQGIGTSLEKLLNNPNLLKVKMIENWDSHCLKKITIKHHIPLSGDFEKYVNAFNFSIFSSRSEVELIEGHAKTGFHAVRFGGGLPERQNPATPPLTPAENESRYIRQLFDAYGDHLGEEVLDALVLESHSNIKRDYLRQRERFYHAESLKNFARDNVPPGTFDSLQDEIYHGVVDVCESDYLNGFERMKSTVTQASSVVGTSNLLMSSVKTQDRQGICHQLANDDRLRWVAVYD